MADEITFSGPFFDDRYDAAAARMVTRVETDISERGAALVKDALGSSIRVDGPGYAERHVVTVLGGERGVFDNNATYGPWLEGTGSRNAPKTRFPGYHAFRRSVQQIQARADEWAQPAISTFVNEVD